MFSLHFYSKFKEAHRGAFLLFLSSIYTHFNTLKKKALENIVEKGEIAQHDQFHLFTHCFQCNLYLAILK